MLPSGSPDERVEGRIPTELVSVPPICSTTDNRENAGDAPPAFTFLHDVGARRSPAAFVIAFAVDGPRL